MAEPLLLQLEGVLVPHGFVRDLLLPYLAARGSGADDPAAFEAALASGAFRLPLHRDVPRALKRWRAQGRPLLLVAGLQPWQQQLLFRHSPQGDLSGGFGAYSTPAALPPGPGAAILHDAPLAESARTLGWTSTILARASGQTLDPL